jgi:hypothetical protein
MNSAGINLVELRRRALLGQLETADVNLRSGLHQHGLDALVRAHLDRALAHIREAFIAINEQTKVRTVLELAEQLTRIEEMRADLRAQQTPAGENSTSIHA